ncbi:MAG: response regulator transcription factor [Thiotrichaceae bacterium]
MNILIADDHRLFIEGLKQLLHLQYTGLVIEEVTNGNDAHAALSSNNNFDCILLDLKLPRINGFTLLEKLSKQGCLVPVLVISSSEDPEDINLVLKLGASGFISKSFAPAEMYEAIDIILSGGIYTNNLTHTGDLQKKVNAWGQEHNITNRQLEVLRHVKNGYSNDEIASQLSITKRTVKAHLGTLFEKMDAKSRTELVRKANQLGLD